MSGHIRKLCGLASGLILAGALAGCATYDKCGFEGCPGDAQVTDNVQTLFDQHPELGPHVERTHLNATTETKVLLSAIDA